MDIKKKPDSYQSLRRIGTERRKGAFWLVSYLILAGAAITVWLLLKLQVFEVFGKYREVLQKISLATFIAVIILAVAKAVEIMITRRTRVVYRRYNFRKMIHLLSWLLVLAVGISFLFKNWYSAVVSLGLISLILGFALQNPISSFIGWLYILLRQPYNVGDRIQIGEFTGDVVEVNYLDTTLWEFGGSYLTNDLPSGRLIRFPNSLVLSVGVFNYSWKKFPFIWNEIPFHVAYESDLQFVRETMRSVAKEHLGAEMEKHIENFKSLVEQTPVDDLNIKEYPFVSFRINANTWVEATVTYLVEPKKAAGTRTELIRKILLALNASPDRVLFPKSNNR